MLLSGGNPIDPEHLGLARRTLRPRQGIGRGGSDFGTRGRRCCSRFISWRTDPATAHPDRAVIEEALKRSGGIVSKAAVELGISRQAFYRRMDQAGIVFERRLKIPS